MSGFSDKVSFIWSVADLLRGDYKQSEYGRVILPLTVLRRLDSVLAPTKDAVLAVAEAQEGKAERLRDRLLRNASGQAFYNTSKLDLARLLGDPTNVAANLVGYIAAFSPNARDIMEHFRFDQQIERLDKAGILYLVVKKFAEVDLHPDRVSNTAMGSIFEELIRKFAEQSNETAGEHFTPREVIRLMVNLLFIEDDAALRKPGVVRTMYDPGCGTGGMLSVAQEHLHDMNPQARLQVYGQEMNAESYAICKADMMLKGEDPDNVVFGNSFTDDGFPDRKFDYLIMNPPFGVAWEKSAKVIEAEHARGHAGRFGPGLPRKSDGAMLFLLHMLSKMQPPSEGGSRLAIVFNGSPLFSGAAESGESEIRRHVIDHDLLEAIIALPDQMFYNTGISTYVWVVTNRKPPERRGKVQLINAVDLFQKMRKSLGDKRKELSDEHIEQITRMFGDLAVGDDAKLFDNDDFGFRRITVERPLRLRFQVSEDALAGLEEDAIWKRLVESKKKDPAERDAEIAEGRAAQEQVLDVLSTLDATRVWTSRPAFLKALATAAKAQGVKLTAAMQKSVVSALGERDENAEICLDAKGNPEPDPELRDYENVPLKEDIDEYMAREVLPHVPDAWVDASKTKIGYEIPFTRHFYVYQPPRPLEMIEKEIRELEAEIQGLLGEVFS
ncbi:MAG: SAM-dependent DNA methyltransferase [Myxococcales bacterium]|nr:SAM-dependent DNA methyltransferase [Myxococcales bacterium]